MVDNRVLQQFAQETIQAGSGPVASSSVKNMADSNLVCTVNYYYWKLLLTVAL